MSSGQNNIKLRRTGEVDMKVFYDVCKEHFLYKEGKLKDSS